MYRPEDCSVIILAAGRGERLKSVGIKPLLEIGGKLIIEYALDLPRKFRPERTIVCIREDMKETVSRLLINGEEFVTVPPFGTLENTEVAIREKKIESQWLMICQSDDSVFCRQTILQELLELAKQKNVNIAVSAIKATAPLSLGSIQVNEDQLMTDFSFDREKPPPKTILSGMYLIKMGTLKNYAKKVIRDNKEERSVVEMIKNALDSGENIAVLELPEGEWSKMNTPEDLERAKARKEV